MYEIKLPDTGCNVYYGTYLDNYYNSVRTRFYINDTKLIKSSTSSYTRLPDGVVCLNQGDLIYKPELEVYFQLASVVFFPLIIYLAYKLVLHKWWRRI